jgi:hypothetical protein
VIYDFSAIEFSIGGEKFNFNSQPATARGFGKDGQNAGEEIQNATK